MDFLFFFLCFILVLLHESVPVRQCLKENHSVSSMELELFVSLSPPKGVPVFSEGVVNPGQEHGRRGMSDILFRQSLP